MHVIRPWLVVGSYAHTTNRTMLDLYRIGAMLQLAARVRQANILTMYLPIEDGQPLEAAALERGIAFIRQQKAAGHIVLSACGAGISRSVTFAMGALIEEEDLPLFDSYREIIALHPEALPHPELIRSLAAYYGEDLSLADAWDGLLAVQDDPTLF